MLKQSTFIFYYIKLELEFPQKYKNIQRSHSMFTKCKQIQTWRQMIPKSPSALDSREIRTNRINVFMNKYSPIKRKQLSASKMFSKSKDRQMQRTFIQNAGNTSRTSANHNNKSLIHHYQTKEVRLFRQKNGETQLQKIQQNQKQNQAQTNKVVYKHFNENAQILMQNNVNKLIIEGLKTQFQEFKNMVLENLRLQHQYIRQTVSKIINSLQEQQRSQNYNNSSILDKKVSTQIQIQSTITQLPAYNNTQFNGQSQTNENNITQTVEGTNLQKIYNQQNSKIVSDFKNIVNQQFNDSSLKYAKMMKLQSTHQQTSLINQSQNKQTNKQQDDFIRDSAISSNFNNERQFVNFKIGQKQINTQSKLNDIIQEKRPSSNSPSNKSKITEGLAQNMKKIQSKLSNKQIKSQNSLIQQVNQSFQVQQKKNQKSSNIYTKGYKSNIVSRQVQTDQKVHGPKQQNNACNKFLNALQKLKSEIRDIKQISNTTSQRKVRFSQAEQSQSNISNR